MDWMKWESCSLFNDYLAGWESFLSTYYVILEIHIAFHGLRIENKSSPLADFWSAMLSYH